MKYVTRKQMKFIDTAATKQFGIPSLLLMENAGRSAADVVVSLAKKKNSRIGIICGYGNNGADGFVVARHLKNRGYTVEVFLIGRQKLMSQESRVNFAIIRKMKIKIKRVWRAAGIARMQAYLKNTDVLIDALFGIGMRGVLDVFYIRLIQSINASTIPVVSIDIPSGLNADSGTADTVAVQAHTTVTMGLAKKGFSTVSAKKYLGKLVVADISLPLELKK